MLTTIIYRSHLREDAPLKALEDMVTAANIKNRRSDVTGILLFNGHHFFQLLEGPEEQVKEIYRCICNDPRHHNIVELMCDYAPARRFGNVGMELFDLQKHERNDVLQAVLNKGTSKFQLTYDDRALQFFRTFVLATEKSSYFEIPAPDYWSFITDNTCTILDESTLPSDTDFSFAFQPIIDPMSQRVIALEALIRGKDGETPATYFDKFKPEDVYTADLQSKKTAFAMASALGLNHKMLSVNLLPMTLVNRPDAVSFLINEIAAHGLVPEQIIVEFTESEVISRFDTFAQAVKSLKAAGICVAIDHFGAGFAGLQLLSRFQPDRIKISRELITDVHKSGPRQAIIQAIIKCCASLEIMISAVGVEKPEEWMWLESAGIEIFQGNLFARACLNGTPSVAWPEKK
ncbi:diguanylate phosphodiesterase [Citrobacter sp. RHBSTW-00678]|jgi:EAL domain-containing protein (putative c-di-GMP-specific phosphodiesterase class I)|uniref:Diguanylate phosphodiesterase n=3 Tax=Citrobacter TaxID=544 RepID=A0A1V8NW41_CITBR|nr:MULTISPECIES: diguanylate phosphodiesterase [Citrobacter]MBA7796817.1 diguanylate phosphodiesterase [Citrobacter sp. RHBSTW-01065]MCI1671946.1 diguanylate phosphodiesterase [Citrobacter freundii]ASE41810.1 diguanylate phosphodiesterase [Citrobacter braakii]AUV26025.1 diguanylate phosphodiesterase [Citrobacter freundii complex sp. CFNIH3]EGT0644003.1 diguanylate phosphodiesterase [Citrobacter braakii]